MKKSLLAFCTAACFLVLPTASHAAETSNGETVFVGNRMVYMTWLMPQLNFTMMKDEFLSIEKEQVVKPSTLEQPVSVKKEDVAKSSTVEQSASIEKEKAAKPSTTKQLVTQKQPSVPVEDEEKAQPSTVTKQLEATNDTVETQAKTPEIQPQPSKVVEESLSDVDKIERAVVELTNKQRAQAGLVPLEMDTVLMAAAREKSQDMKNHRI